jgi:hypothetical protein
MAALLVAGAGAPEDDGNGSPPGDGEFETDGNWTVESGEDLHYENLTLLINGNLTVDFGGKLTLKGVSLIMNCTQDLEFAIRIATGGELMVEDTDGDWTTTNDRSELRSWFQSARYTIQVDGGGKFTVLRSKVADMGDDVIVGLHIESDDVLFDRAVVEAFSSIFVEAAGPTFQSSRITGDLASSLYFDSSDAKFISTVIINCYYGVNARGTPSPQLVDTDVANCFFPLILEDADVTVRGGLLEAAPFGTDVTLSLGSVVTLVDVTFDQFNLNISDTASVLNVYWTLSLRVTDQAYQPLPGASVEANDSAGTTVFTGTTEADGMVHMELLDRIGTFDVGLNATVFAVRNPHSVYVTKERYHARVGFNVTFTMTREVSVLTNLAPFISVRSPLPGTRVVMGQVIQFDASDTFDPNGDTMTFNWTTDIGDRLLYSGPDAVMESSLLLGESEVTLTVSDGQGGVNSTTIEVEVLQASQQTYIISETLYTANLVATFGGEGGVQFTKASYPQPYPRELIGIFMQVHVTGDTILAFGEITVTFSPTLLPYGMSPASLVIVREDGGLWVDLPDSVVDTGANTVTASLDSVGLYAVKGFMPENIPPRLWQQVGGELLLPADVTVGPGTQVDLFYIIEDELPSFARLEVMHLPDFLRLDSTSKRITGTAPDEAGTYDMTLMAMDVGRLSDTHDIKLVINGSLMPPQLHSAIVDPPDGDTRTHFELKVLYMSPENLPPQYVRALFADNDTVELIPVNITDDGYLAGVLYHAFVRLEEGDHKIHFEASDGTRTVQTEEPVKVSVSSFTIEVTDQELAIIVAVIIAIIVVVLIIRTTSDRYKKLKEAHYGRDSEDKVEYIEPDDGQAEDAPEDDEADAEATDDDRDEDEVHVVKMDSDEMTRLEGDVDRLEEELSEIDDDIDREEEELARIDEEIEEIIDELDDDRDRAA